MGYADITGFVIYWKTDQNIYIKIFHHAFFDEYNYQISAEDNQTTGYLLLWKYPETLLHNSDILNLIPC